jgi:AcrR family transcriptional regulator
MADQQAAARRGTPVTRRGPYRNGTQTRSQIVQAAAKVFAEHGYVGGSLRQIAAEVRVSPAALLQHFGTKEGLLAAVLEEWRVETARIKEGTRPGVDYFLSLRELMKYHVSHRGLIELFLTMVTEASSDSHPAQAFIQAHYAHTMSSFTEHLLEAQELGQIAPMTPWQMEVESRSLIAVLDGLELQWLLDPAMDLVGVFDAHMAATLARWRGSGNRR